MIQDNGKKKKAEPEKAVESTAKNTNQKSGLMPPWKPGQSGNPNGRPKGSINLTSRLRAALANRDGARADKIIESLLDKAEEGDARHLIEVFNRIDGKVPDKVQAEGDVRVVVEFVKEGDPNGADLPRTTAEPA